MSAFGLLIRGFSGGRPLRLSQRVLASFLTLAVALLAVALLGSPALAWDDDDDDNGGSMNKISDGRCPGKIYKNTRLVADIIAAGAGVGQPPDPDPCIEFAANNIRLDMNGFFINVSSGRRTDTAAIRAIGNGPNSGCPGGCSNVRIEGDGGFILTAYPQPPNLPSTEPTDPPACIGVVAGASPCAIHIHGGSHVRIREVFVRNTTAGAVFAPPTVEMMEKGVSFNVITAGVPVCPAPMGRGGAGILLQNTYKAKVHDNWVECYNFGVFLANSDGGRDSDGMVSHNLVKDNARTGAQSASGLVLDNSSGWLVNRNILTGNGSDPASAADSNILVFTGSIRNRFDQNKTDNNQGPGLFVDEGAINNVFSRNHVTWNSGGFPNADPEDFAGGWDMGDANPKDVNGGFANAYKRNTCRWKAGPGVPPGECNPAIN